MLHKLSLAIAAGTLLSGVAVASVHETGAQRLGFAIPPTSVVDRVVEVGPATKYINVTDGEKILFKIGDKSFAWQFTTAHSPHPIANLSEIAPRDINAPQVRVYVGENVYDHSD